MAASCSASDHTSDGDADEESSAEASVEAAWNLLGAWRANGTERLLSTTPQFPSLMGGASSWREGVRFRAPNSGSASRLPLLRCLGNVPL